MLRHLHDRSAFVYLLITHDLAVVRDICHRVVVLDARPLPFAPPVPAVAFAGQEVAA